MNKLFCLLLGIGILGLIFPAQAQAALVTATTEGELVINVLAFTTDPLLASEEHELAVKDIVQTGTPSPNTRVVLDREGEQTVLLVHSGDDTKQLDVTGYTREIVEIEEREAPKRVSISARDGKFGITQQGVIAKTEFAIEVNAEDHRISVNTPNGSRFIFILPYDAAAQTIKSNLLTNIPGEITLTEGNEGELAYEIRGQRFVNILNLVSIPVYVTAYISAQNGRVMEVEQPLWYS